MAAIPTGAVCSRRGRRRRGARRGQNHARSGDRERLADARQRRGHASPISHRARHFPAKSHPPPSRPGLVERSGGVDLRSPPGITSGSTPTTVLITLSLGRVARRRRLAPSPCAATPMCLRLRRIGLLRRAGGRLAGLQSAAEPSWLRCGECKSNIAVRSINDLRLGSLIRPSPRRRHARLRRRYICNIDGRGPAVGGGTPPPAAV